MDECILILIYILTVIVLKYITYSTINSYACITLPYVAIVILNNFIFHYRFNYYEINSHIIYTTVFGLLFFAMGSSVPYFINKNNSIKNDRCIHRLNIGMMKRAMNAIVILMFLVTLIYLYIFTTKGAETVKLNDYALLNENSLLSHLRIWLGALLPLILFFDIKLSQKLLLIGFGLFLTSISFVKYHAIFISLYIFFYYIFMKSPRSILEIVRKCIIASVVIFSIFLLNYYVLLNGNLNIEFLKFILNHIWKYIAGGTIAFESVVDLSISDPAFSKTLDMFLPIPKLILNKIGFQIPTFSSLSTTTHWVKVSASGQITNVFSTFSQICAGGLLSSAVVLLFWGAITSYVYKIGNETRNSNVKLCYASIISFMVLSFFANFWILSNPWEYSLSALIIPCFLRTKHHQCSHRGACIGKIEVLSKGDKTVNLSTKETVKTLNT